MLAKESSRRESYDEHERLVHDIYAFMHKIDEKRRDCVVSQCVRAERAVEEIDAGNACAADRARRRSILDHLNSQITMLENVARYERLYRTSLKAAKDASIRFGVSK